MRQRVLIVGSVALDDIITPGGGGRDLLGGSAVYGAVAAANFAPVDIVGVAGEDFADQHVATLRSRGINLEGLECVPGGATFHWAGEYQADTNEAITHRTELGVFAEFNPRLPESYRDDAFVFLANIDPELQLRVLEQVRRPVLTLCDSMNLWINIKRDALLEVLRRVDVALLNEGEARLLFETNSLPVAAERLLELGVKRAIIKQGSHGAQMFSAEGTFAAPAIPLRRVVDPTGAGDTFAGGLIGYLAAQDELDELTFRKAVLVGTACASFVVEDFSIGRTRELARHDILARCMQLYDTLRCDPVEF